ncbi:gustatory receptor for sugar taste 43a-like [Chrysoperla carnea]|uniref:gustatory receptor for sugar taste 43a-like n=1 Tax=Chrysoperla carnea TaxID=189513 RepID=UPI001D0993B5|nr:gustatory receptor for sugar taste 43a-like [Chrysoperla carnea]
MLTPTSLTEQIAITDGPIFYVLRFFGLAPCSVEKTDGGKISFHLSIFYCIYSFTVGTIAVVWGTYGGILSDIWAGNKSIRMKERTDRIVTCADLSSILFLACLGIYGAPFRLPNIRKFYNNLLQFDRVLQPIQVKQFRNHSYLYLGVTVILLTIVLVLDVSAWIRFAEQRSDSEYVVWNYLAFYFSYYVIMILQLQYLHGAKHIELRFKKLNENLAISEMENSDYKSHKQPRKMSVRPAISLKEQKLFDNYNFKINSPDYVLQLCRVHSTLCEAVVQLNEGFGFVVLMILVSGILHSIETAYFLLVELSGRNDHLFTILQFCWIGVHFLRILIIIQPANSAMREAKITQVQVCNILCYVNLDDKLRKQLELFSLQLIHRKVEFHACEICTLDRRLLSAVITDCNT